MSERAAAIILKNNKILLVTGFDESFYWTPGGKIEDGESQYEALRRELKEELSIGIISMKYYMDYESVDENGNEQKVYCHIVNFDGKLKPGAEVTKIFWYSRKNSDENNPKIFKGIKENLMPQLIKDGLVK